MDDLKMLKQYRKIATKQMKISENKMLTHEREYARIVYKIRFIALELYVIKLSQHIKKLTSTKK